MKKLVTIFLLLATMSPCFAQSGDLKSTYKGIGISAGRQTVSYTLFTYNDDKPYPTFNTEGGLLYMSRLGASRFYFETGAYLGLINMGFDYYHNGPLERVISRHIRLKVPVNFDYMIPLGQGYELIPSLGLGFTASYITSLSNGEIEDNCLGFGGIFPHFGVSMMKDHFLVGVSHDYFASINSEIVINGILFLNLAYLF